MHFRPHSPVIDTIKVQYCINHVNVLTISICLIFVTCFLSNHYKSILLLKIFKMKYTLLLLLLLLLFDISYRGLCFASRTNLESGPPFAKVWFGDSCQILDHPWCEPACRNIQTKSTLSTNYKEHPYRNALKNCVCSLSFCVVYFDQYLGTAHYKRC